MKLATSVRISGRQLAAHRTRTALALLGIIIGVSAVIVVIAVGQGAEREVVGRIEAMGTNLIVVSAGQARPTAGRQPTRSAVTTMTVADGAALVEECPSVLAAAPVESQRVPVRYGALSANTSIVATTAVYADVRRIRATNGAFFTGEDEAAALRVALVGPTVVANLFGGRDPLGETIRLNTVPFEVVGVLEARGLDMNGVDQDDLVIVPLRTALRRLFNQAHVSGIAVQARREDLVPAAADEIRALLRERHRLDRTGAPDDFTIQTQIELVAAQAEVSGTFTRLVGGIAAVSLLVGGFGILAVMLMAVRERTREIGLRMAVGASRRQVRLQFVLEAAALGVGGGLAGILLGLAAGGVLAAATSWAIHVSPASVALSFGFSLAVGLVFGVYPAQRAARLDPVEALRSE
jgi:putative ABC transport system permease protein